MNDLHKLKEEIYNCGYVSTLLESIGCEINYSTSNEEKVEAARPNGNNMRSVQVYLNEYLTSRVRSKAHIPVKDIYDLISYLHFGKETEEELKKCIPKSKKYIIDTLGLKGFSSTNEQVQDDPNAWLKEIKHKQKKRIVLEEIEPNPVLPNNILEEFVSYPHALFLKDGISYETQKQFNICFDIMTERICFPVYDKRGNIIGIKGRATREEDEKYYKYMPIYAFQKSKDIFNLDKALPYILEKNEIIFWESEKSVFKSWQHNVKHTVSQMGSDISKIQAEIAKRISPEIKIILGYDSDKSVEEIKQYAKVFGDYEHVYAIVDVKGLLDEKMSPADADEDTFHTLLNSHCYKVFPNQN